MAQIKDYISGKILSDTKFALQLIKFLKIPLLGSKIGNKLLNKIKPFEPNLIDINIAQQLIQQSKKCAVGERVCKVLHKNSEFTESVFLDELAKGLVEIGKAKYVTKQQAITTLKKYKNPIILSKVSGNFVEICRSTPKECVYWNMERKGYKVIAKFPKNN